MLASAQIEAPPAEWLPPRDLAGVRVFGSVAEALPAWMHLLGLVPASVYQSPAWIEAWLETLGTIVEPTIVVGYDTFGVPAALLPLGVMRRGGIGIARFLGHRDANFGLGLLVSDVDWAGGALHHLLQSAAESASIDVFWLSHQPTTFADRVNPFEILPSVPSPSAQHETRLGRDADRVFARTLSKRTRKQIRQKETKLSAIGPVQHDVARSDADAERIARALTAQHAARFGAGRQDAARERFLLAGSRLEGSARVELHALICGGEIVATFAGAGHGDRYSGMMLAISANEAWARFSPGELLLARLVAAKCAEGFAVLDLGVGEGRHKQTFCPDPVPLFETVLGMTWRGRVAAGAVLCILGAKRRIKQTPWLWTRLRRVSGRLSLQRID